SPPADMENPSGPQEAAAPAIPEDTVPSGRETPQVEGEPSAREVIEGAPVASDRQSLIETIQKAFPDADPKDVEGFADEMLKNVPPPEPEPQPPAGWMGSFLHNFSPFGTAEASTRANAAAVRDAGWDLSNIRGTHFSTDPSSRTDWA